MEWRSCGFNVQISVKIGLFLIMLIVARAKFFPLSQVLVRYVFFVKNENGKYGKKELLNFSWSTVKWFRAQTKDIRWFVEIGYHYTRRFGSSERMKNKFFI